MCDRITLVLGREKKKRQPLWHRQQLKNIEYEYHIKEFIMIYLMSVILIKHIRRPIFPNAAVILTVEKWRLVFVMSILSDKRNIITTGVSSGVILTV